MNVRIDESWGKRLQEEFDKPYFEQLVTFVKTNISKRTYFLPGLRYSIYLTHARSRRLKSLSWDKTPILIRGNTTGSASRYPRAWRFPAP